MRQLQATFRKVERNYLVSFGIIRITKICGYTGGPTDTERHQTNVLNRVIFLILKDKIFSYASNYKDFAVYGNTRKPCLSVFFVFLSIKRYSFDLIYEWSSDIPFTDWFNHVSHIQDKWDLSGRRWRFCLVPRRSQRALSFLNLDIVERRRMGSSQHTASWRLLVANLLQIHSTRILLVRPDPLIYNFISLSEWCTSAACISALYYRFELLHRSSVLRTCFEFAKLVVQSL